MKKEKVARWLKFIGIIGLVIGGICSLLTIMYVLSLEDLWVNIVIGLASMMFSAGIVGLAITQDPIKKSWIVGAGVFACLGLYMIFSWFLIQ